MVVDRNIISCPIVPTLGMYSRMILHAATQHVTGPASPQHWPTTRAQWPLARLTCSHASSS